LNNVNKYLSYLLVSTVCASAEQLSDSFRLDGYGNVSAYSSSKQNIDAFQLSGGLQGRYEITDNMSITGQLHFKEGQNNNQRPSNSLSDFDSELKWFYLDYYFDEDVTLRIGAFQFPVFKSSETGDIGYTYTWTQTPLEFYGVFGCDDFEGIEVLKNFSYEDFDFLAQVSFGQSVNELSNANAPAIEGKVRDLVGLTLKTTHDMFSLNVGYLQAHTTLSSTDETILSPEVDFYMYALESEIYLNDYTIKSGFIKTKLSNVFAEDLNYYTSLEYSYNDFTPYILYSNEILYFQENQNRRDDDRRRELKDRSIEKYSLGLRYDYNSNIAFKLGYTHEKVSLNFYGENEKEHLSSNTYMGTMNVVF